MKGYLWANQIAWKDYSSHLAGISRRVKEASLATMEASRRPVRYLAGGEESKEQMARDIAANDNITGGSICAFTAVEPCWSWAVRGDRASHKLQLVRSLRKCLHVYHYWIDDVFGFMSARLQTWFPFTVYFYLNGREWLARQMSTAGIRYQRQDNCFPWIEDFTRAQALMDEQLNTNWAQALNAATGRIHPLLPEICSRYPMNYYWTCFQSEWTMDIVFRDPEQLRHLYPQLIHLGMVGLSSPDVMRFMGKKVSCKGDTTGPHGQEVITDLKVRSQGVRIKHRLGKNSIKLYDKAYTERGAVLRPEVTVNAPGQFRVFRHKNGDAEGPLKWRPMRSGLADLHRRAEVSQAALDRYCDALAKVDDTTTLQQLTASMEKRVRWHGQPVRALHPFYTEDLALLTAVGRGEFTINGLRNRDLQSLLFTSAPTGTTDARRRSASVSRKLRILRAHGIIQKLPHTHRYQITARGRLILNAVLSAQRTTTQQLTTLVA